MSDPIIKEHTDNLIYIFPNSQSLFQYAAEDFTRRAIKQVQTKNEFNVVLSGGSTPIKFLDDLTSLPACRDNTPWDKIRFFLVDERYVPLDNPNSNYLMAYKHLFSKVPVLEENIFPIQTHFKDPNDAALNYQKCLQEAFNLKPNEFPYFDVVYLGLGDDGHTASLMPHSEVVRVYSLEAKSLGANTTKNELVTSLWVPKLSMYRITLTPPTINNATNVIFLVSGLSKAPAVWSTINGPYAPGQTPAQLIHSVHNKNIWFLDTEAADRIEKNSFKSCV
jgi:6-phosphogluconolactonase